MGRSAGGVVGANMINHLREQVVAAVDIADRIHPPPRGNGEMQRHRRRRLLLAFPDFGEGNHVIVRESCRERLSQYENILVYAVSLNKKQHNPKLDVE